MKKSLFILSLLSMLVLALALIGCKPKTQATTKNEPTTTTEPDVTTTEPDVTTTEPDVTTTLDPGTTSEDPGTTANKTKLATPTVTVDENGLASWDEVANASGYVYNLNGTERATNRNSYQLSDGDTFKVMALGDDESYTDSDYSNEVTYTAIVEEVTGIPAPAEGFYMRDPDVLQAGNKRYLLYTTNKTKAEDDAVLAIRVGELNEDLDWVYGDETIVVTPSTDGWDQYISSGSLVKGTFAYNEETYSYMIAYAATESDSNVCNEIGIAVSKEVTGPYVKVGTEALIKYDAEVYGANMVGNYAPSLLNYNKGSLIRIYYTYADAYGHFAYFFDADMSDLNHISGAKAMITNEGNIQGGDAVTMFPNADFLYDAGNKMVICVKDYSPTPAFKPSVANEFEILHIAEAELYTTDKGEGWVSEEYYDYLDLDNGYDRCYSCALVSDEYGHLAEGVAEVVYTVCEEGNNYLFTQKLMTWVLLIE